MASTTTSLPSWFGLYTFLFIFQFWSNIQFWMVDMAIYNLEGENASLEMAMGREI